MDLHNKQYTPKYRTALPPTFMEALPSTPNFTRHYQPMANYFKISLSSHPRAAAGMPFGPDLGILHPGFYIRRYIRRQLYA